MVQAFFPRIKTALLCKEDGEKDIIMRLVIHLHNFADEIMGLNQVFNFFMEHTNSYYLYTIDNRVVKELNRKYTCIYN